MIEFYGYNKCDTCRKAKKVLDGKKVVYKEFDITQNPPSKRLLQTILASGEYALSDLFNKSGELYRQFNMKEKVKTMKEGELVDLLAQHGKLVKRPIITDGKQASVGFDQARIQKLWL